MGDPAWTFLSLHPHWKYASPGTPTFRGDILYEPQRLSGGMSSIRSTSFGHKGEAIARGLSARKRRIDMNYEMYREYTASPLDSQGNKTQRHMASMQLSSTVKLCITCRLSKCCTPRYTALKTQRVPAFTTSVYSQHINPIPLR